MKMKLSEAKKLKVGQILYHIRNKNADGTAQRWKVNGKIRGWKRDINRIEIPIKNGLYNYGYLNNSNLRLLTIKEINNNGKH